MRLDVAFTADTVVPAQLRSATVLVVDVLRASTTMITALGNGCAGLVPVAEPAEALARARALGEGTLLAGERGRVSLEDKVCAGLLVDRLARDEPGAEVTEDARAALELGRGYGKAVARLAQDSSWARHLALAGRGGDVAACLVLDTTTLVPVLDVDKVVVGSR